MLWSSQAILAVATNIFARLRFPHFPLTLGGGHTWLSAFVAEPTSCICLAPSVQLRSSATSSWHIIISPLLNHLCYCLMQAPAAARRTWGRGCAQIEGPLSLSHPVPPASTEVANRVFRTGDSRTAWYFPLSAELRSSQRNPCSTAGPTERKERESSAASSVSSREEPPPKRWESRCAMGAHNKIIKLFNVRVNPAVKKLQQNSAHKLWRILRRCMHPAWAWKKYLHWIS